MKYEMEGSIGAGMQATVGDCAACRKPITEGEFHIVNIDGEQTQWHRNCWATTLKQQSSTGGA